MVPGPSSPLGPTGVLTSPEVGQDIGEGARGQMDSGTPGGGWLRKTIPEAAFHQPEQKVGFLLLFHLWEEIAEFSFFIMFLEF